MTFEAALTAYLDHLHDDYAKSGYTAMHNTWVPDGGNLYLKITHWRSRDGLDWDKWGSAHSFIVMNEKPGSKFKLGDILMAASWRAPAKNFSRGNIFNPDSYKMRARWAGVS